MIRIFREKTLNKLIGKIITDTCRACGKNLKEVDKIKIMKRALERRK